MHDVEGALAEMRALFTLYDADDSGELDGDEMAKVLADAGAWGSQDGMTCDVWDRVWEVQGVPLVSQVTK